MPYSTFPRTSLLAPLLLVTLAGCGAAEKPVLRPSRPLAPEERAFFENGVDYIGSPGHLSGEWRAQWDRELQGRAARADVVLVVDVETVRTDIDPDRRRTYRLVASVRDVLFGRWPSRDEPVVFRVREDEEGFGTVTGREQQLMATRMVAFVRVVPGPDGAALLRWHLSPATEDVLGEVRRLLRERTRARRPRGRRRVIVH